MSVADSSLTTGSASAATVGMRGRLQRILTRARVDHPVVERLLVNSGWWAAADLTVAALAFVQSVLLVRLLGVSGFGAWAVIVTYVSTVERLISFRIGEFVVKYLTESVSGGDRDRAAMSAGLAYAVEIGTGLLAFAAAWLLAPLAATWLMKTQAWTPMLRLYCGMLLAGLATDVSIATLQSQGRFRTVSLLDIVKAVIVVAAIGGVALAGGSLRGVLIAILAATAGHALVIHALAGRSLRGTLHGARWQRMSEIFSAERRDIVAFLFSTNITESMSLIAKDSENLWLTYFRGPTEVAYYKLAYSIASLCYIPVRSLTLPTFRELSINVANREFGHAIALLKRMTRLASVFVMAIAAATALLSVPLIRVAYGRQMVPAYPALVILLGGMGVSQALYWSRPVLLALGEARFLLKMGLALVVIKIGLLFLFVPFFGYVGNALSLSVLYVVGVAWSVHHAVRVLRRSTAAAG